MRKKISLIYILVGLLLGTPAEAINLNTAVWGAWGYDGSQNANGSAGDFIIAGGIGKGGMHGTFSDEWGVVGIVANTIVEHGGYFCPYQVQCANKRKKKKTWTMYYWPTGFSYDKCAWLCESGYSGQNCIAQTSTPLTCDETIYSTADSGKFGGISLKTSGGDADQKEQEVTGFNQWGTDPECDVVLGVIRYLNHGVVAAPVKICCGRNNWKSIDSYVNSVDVAVGQQKLLCASGYTANDTGTDCVQINPDACATQNMTFCANFPRESYDSAIHTLEETEEGCVKYFCSEPGKAFPASGDTSCVECDEGVRGGASRNNGVCMHCEMGQYFDTKTSSCRTAKAYSKTDMQYGDGQTKNTVEIENQCWLSVDPEEYANCVKGN